MPWTQNNQVVEIGYSIPALFVSPPEHYEKLTVNKSGVYALVLVEQDRELYTVEDVNSLVSQAPSALVGKYKQTTQLSIGITSDNEAILIHQDDLVPITDAEWLAIKEPLRKVANQIQLVLFNDGTDTVIIQGYELLQGDVGYSRVRTN